METWKAVIGVILIVAGAIVAWQGSNTVNQCNTLLGKLSTVVSSIFGGTQAQACYNAEIAVIGGVIVALIGVVVVFASIRRHKK
jgi:ascorbate-specific PTS system EIIC-type component UlaA